MSFYLAQCIIYVVFPERVTFFSGRFLFALLRLYMSSSPSIFHVNPDLAGSFYAFRDRTTEWMREVDASLQHLRSVLEEIKKAASESKRALEGNRKDFEELNEKVEDKLRKSAQSQREIQRHFSDKVARVEAAFDESKKLFFERANYVFDECMECKAACQRMEKEHEFRFNIIEMRLNKKGTQESQEQQTQEREGSQQTNKPQGGQSKELSKKFLEMVGGDDMRDDEIQTWMRDNEGMFKVNTSGAEGGRTALMLCVKRPRRDLFKYLLSRKETKKSYLNFKISGTNKDVATLIDEEISLAKAGGDKEREATLLEMRKLLDETKRKASE